MNKPTIIQVEESKKKIIQTVNSCQLSPLLLEPIIKDIYNEIVSLKQKEYEKAKEEYEKSKQQEKKEE